MNRSGLDRTRSAIVIQCKDCEFFDRAPNGGVILRCDPFATIKEPQCLQKWHLLKLDAMVRNYQASAAFQQRLAPLQEKMIRFMEREMDDVDEADKWKYGSDDDDDDLDDEDDDTFKT